MSGKTPQSTAKKVVECPHCGFKQLESPYAKSTFCRKCSEHYDIGKPVVEMKEEGPGLLDRIAAFFGHKKTRDISCFKCGAEQTISRSAKSSLCPHCSTYLDLTDFKIDTAYSRSIETQGTVTVTKSGDITSPKVACSEFYLYGRLRGNVICSGEAYIKLKGKVTGGLEAKKIIIEKRADVEMVRPLKARTIEVNGKLLGRLEVDGTVIINKKGYVEGTILAKGIQIEKGGIFSGELIIDPLQFREEGEYPEEEEETEVLSRPIDFTAASSDSPIIIAGPEAEEEDRTTIVPVKRQKRKIDDVDDGPLNFGVG